MLETNEHKHRVNDVFQDSIVGEKFVPAETEGDIAARIEKNVSEWLTSRKA